jgi:hypothetical protein
MATYKVGPTFHAELEAAGVPMDGYSWEIHSGEFIFADSTPQATRDAVAAVYAAHDPTKQTDPPIVPYPPGPPPPAIL